MSSVAEMNRFRAWSRAMGEKALKLGVTMTQTHDETFVYGHEAGARIMYEWLKNNPAPHVENADGLRHSLPWNKSCHY